MPDERGRATPRNIGTPCENIDVESATENNSTIKRLWLKSAVKKYFRLGVHTSDPLLNAAKWIAYVTEIGAAVVVALPLLLYFLVVLTNESAIFQTFEAFLIFAMICWICGLVAVAYVHFMWVKPSRHMLLGLQQLSTLEFLPWMLTAFIHSIPLALACFYYMYTSSSTYPYEKILRTDLTCWDWTFAIVGAGLVLAPQVVVLAAAQRVRRLSNERTRIRSPHLSSTAPQVVSLPTTTSPQPANNIRINPSHDVCLPLTVNLPESSQNDFDDLPPSYYMAVLQCPPEYSKS
jgi:ABC-type glycerol-3-phosphate transport system permease component